MHQIMVSWNIQKAPKCRKYINKQTNKKNLMVSCDPKDCPYRRMCYVYWLDGVITKSNSIPGANDRFPRCFFFNITCFKMRSLKNRRQRRGEAHSCLSRILSRQPPNQAVIAVDQDIMLLKLMSLPTSWKSFLDVYTVPLRYVLYCNLLCYCRFDYTGYFSWWGKGGAKENFLL